MPFKSGMKLSHYEIIEPLGAGGMGEVYRAYDNRLERDVAIKGLPAAFSSDPDRLNRFVREAKVLASLNHPNIGAIYGLEETPNGEQYLVLEMIEGEPLSKRLGRGPLPMDVALRLGRDIAEAFEAAHERKVVHRDLKPGNVMLTARGGVKVLDFGLAQHTNSLIIDKWENELRNQEVPSGNSVTRSVPYSPGVGMVEGTPGYMSPEQARGEPQDYRTDVFAFGCLLFECLAGECAFGGKDAEERMAAISISEPPWSILPDALPHKIRILLESCLEKEVTRRLATIKDARLVLEEVLDIRPIVSESASSNRNNLPFETSSFIGREQDLAECERLLNRTRLLTLTGMGGIGKTRLALRFARTQLENYPEGVWLVDLASLTDPTLLVQIVARTLGAKEQAGKPLMMTLKNYLAKKSMLILLDNCEHLIDSCAELVLGLLSAGSNVKVIVTSREGLGIPGEQSLVLHSLSLPQMGNELEVEAVKSAEAVRLFVERVRLIRPEFDINQSNASVIAEICRRLDGIPLAIELAAARMRAMSVEQIFTRLEDRFRLLTGGSRTALPRHQTLSATIQWSYDQLTPEEQSIFRLLSVFAGSWTLEAVAGVVGGKWNEFEILDMLTRLVDKSLILMEREGSTEPRYRMLETVRQYALERLSESGEGEAARTRHLGYYVSLAEEVRPRLSAAEQGKWLDRLEQEHDNVRAALHWSLTASGGIEAGPQLAVAVSKFWEVRGYCSEGRRWLKEILGKGVSSAETKAELLHWEGIMAFRQGDYLEALARIEQSLSIRREIGDEKGISSSLHAWGSVAAQQGEYALAQSRFEESLAISRNLGDKYGIAITLNYLGIVARIQGDFALAKARYTESLAIKRQLGDKLGISATLANLGIVAQIQGEYALAQTQHEQALAIQREIGDKGGCARSLGLLGTVAFHQKNFAMARVRYMEALAICQGTGDKGAIAPTINNLGLLAVYQGEYKEARELLIEALLMYREIGSKLGVVDCLEPLAMLAEAEGRYEQAGKLFGAAEGLRQAIGSPIPVSERADHERCVTSVRDALGDGVSNRVWSIGRKMTMEEAVEYAMSRCI